MNQVLLQKCYKIFIPHNFVTTKGIARRFDLDLTQEELREHCLVSGNVKILIIKRMNRKVINDDGVSSVPSGTVRFTFYIQCFRCLRYGHTRNNCKGKEKCFNCSADKHDKDTLNFNCQTYFCKAQHKTTDKNALDA